MLLNLPYEILLMIFSMIESKKFFKLLSINKEVREFILTMLNQNPKSFSFNLKNCNPKDSIKYLQSVRSLNLSKSTINDDQLKYLFDVYSLNISNCKSITDRGLSFLTQVVKLNVSYNGNITDNGLKNFQRIKKINLCFCGKITDKGIENLVYGKTLNSDEPIPTVINTIRKINLQCCMRITSKCLQHLRRARSINMLYGPQAYNEDLQYIPNIKTLKIDGLDVSDKNLTNLKSVKHIFFGRNYPVIFMSHLDKLTKLILPNVPEHIEYIDFNKMPNLVKADLSGCINLFDEQLKGLSKVRKLNLKECYDITDVGLSYLTMVKKINISYCFRITDSGLKYLSNADYVNICGCLKITNDGFIYLKRVPKLVVGYTTLSLYDCMMEGNGDYEYLTISDNTKQLITGQAFHHLENTSQIKIINCSYIRDIDLESFINLPTLSKIDLRYCNNITNQGLSALCNIPIVKISNNYQISSKGISYLTNSKKISIESCPKINSFPNLTGLKKLVFKTMGKINIQLIQNLNEYYHIDTIHVYSRYFIDKQHLSSVKINDNIHFIPDKF
ncbi:hypothetical protein lvs_R470 [Acanthamoeba polyphaga lentillevirus]|nr:hypothetical protein lvs_R470 [Acanthamoeba polyphaga lentillevirus]